MDIIYLLFFQKLRDLTGSVFDSLMLFYTSLGEGTITWILMAVVYWCLDKRAGQLMASNVALSCTLNQYMKQACKIERPWIRDGRIRPVEAALAQAGGYSFPSGHTARAAAVWGALGIRLWKLGKRAVAVVCAGIVCLTAFTRNYLGVHTPQDVIAALVIGAVILAATERLINWAERGEMRDVLLAALGCLLCFIPMLKVGCLSNAGAGMGFFLGWILERKLVGFSVNGTWQEKAVRASAGLAGVLLLLKVLPAILGLAMEAKYAGFFSSFLLMFFIIAAYPFFFKRVTKYRWWIAGVIAAVLLILGMGILFASMEKHDRAPEEKEVVPEEVESEEAEIQIIGHRGYAGAFPENTLDSFAGAIEIGVDYIELDVQLSKDGQIIVYHDSDLLRTAGREGLPSDYSYEELAAMDVGSWFSDSFTGLKIPTLEEVLELVRESDVDIYLELKDIGKVDGYVEKVLAAVVQYGMEERCLFASFSYEYLTALKNIEPRISVLYNTLSGTASLPEEFPAEYYGLYVETVTAETIQAIHQSGSKAFVWTADKPEQMKNLINMGADGICTNEPGLARVVTCPAYKYLMDHFEDSFPMPGLYGMEAEKLRDMVVQGFTRAGDKLVISAYSYSGNQNSMLYLSDLSGKLLRVVDLGFAAHVGGIAWDEAHDLLWVTGPDGWVYAVSWSEIERDAYQGSILVSFDAGLLNHNQAKVASFLTLYHGELFVGSYVDGGCGAINRYSLEDVGNPKLVSVSSIPERIQGVTFYEKDGVRYMLLSQGYQTEDAGLLYFLYDEAAAEYLDPVECYVLPEGVEQIQSSANGLYLLFESAVWPYRATARIPNDQIYLVRIKE